MLYDVPVTNDPYTAAVVNTSTIGAECGLLSNTSVGYWNDPQQSYFVNVSGLGEVALNVLGMSVLPCFILALSMNIRPKSGVFYFLGSCFGWC